MISSRKKRKIIELAIKKDSEYIKNKMIEITECFEKDNYKKCIEISFELLKIDVVQRNPHILAPIIKNLGSSFLKLNKYDEALKYYSETLRIIETNTEVERPKKEDVEKEMRFVTVLKLIAEGEIEKAAEKCDIFLENDQESIGLMEIKGNLLCALKKYEEAILWYEEISQKENINLDALYHKIGVCYFYLSDLEKSRCYLKKAIAENPQNGKVYFALGEVEFKQALFNDAMSSFEKGEKLIPEETGFLLYLIEIYRMTGIINKITPKTEKIIRSDNPQIIKFLIEWLKKIEEKDLKKQIFFSILSLAPKKEIFFEILLESLTSEGGELTAFIAEFKKEKELNRRKNDKHIQFINNLTEKAAKELETKKARVKELCVLFSPFFEEKEIEKAVIEWKNDVKEALEHKLLEKIINDRGLPQEWLSFAAEIKKTQQDLIKPLKAINCLLLSLNDFAEKAAVAFCAGETGAIKVEEDICSVKFLIFPDFPGNFSEKIIELLALFYKERLELWDKLPDLICEGKFIPPPVPTLSDWIKKTREKIPDNILFLEELNREGNNLKLDILMGAKNLNKKFIEKLKPIDLLAKNSNSIPFAMRFQEKEIKEKDGELKFLAFKYFSYIRKNTKIKI